MTMAVFGFFTKASQLVPRTKKMETFKPKGTQDANSPAEVIILEKKLKTGKDFCDSTVKLKDALEKGEMETAAGLLRRRSELIATMDALDTRLAGYPKPFSSEKKRVEIRTKITDQINEDLKQAFAINQECEAIAAAKLEELRNGLSAIHNERTGLRAYTRRGTQNPRFLSIRT
jgi:hypothetical protein